ISQMDSGGVLEEMAARCVATVVFYHDTDRSVEACESMRNDILSIAESVTSLEFDTHECDEVLYRVRQELVSRYSHEAGGRIFSEFDRIFEAARMVSNAARG